MVGAAVKTLGLIVARGGSVGIPGKNLAPCAGQPLVWWTIQAAQASRLDHVAISTDCPEIAEYARAQNVHVPFMRPWHLAHDRAKTVNVVKHAVEMLPEFDAVFTLQPTNPLRTVQDINGAIGLMEMAQCESVIGWSPVGDYYPERMATMGHDGQPTYVIPGWERRQSLPQYYHRNGSVYLSRTRSIPSAKHLAQIQPERMYFIETYRDVNIDNAEDLAEAERRLLRLSEAATVPDRRLAG